MKKNYKKNFSGILFLFFIPILSFAQWQTNGPFGGPAYSSAVHAGKLFTGTENGAFVSTDAGLSWTEANTGIERLTVGSLTSDGANLYAGSSGNGVFFSTDNGITWTSSNTGITTMAITSLFAADSGLYAGTPDGVFFSSNNAMSWTLRNSGIPATYEIYSFAEMGDTVYGGTYGMGLYQTFDQGVSWTVVNNGFPPAVFVYALITDGNNIYAGTSAGIYRSADRGANWLLSNTGFPSGMWAKSFAVKPGFVFAGTYSEGVFVSVNSGASWTAVNIGIPNLPFPTGLPNNYPSVEDLAVSGSNVIASTVNGNYISINDGVSWLESNAGMLATDILCVAAKSTTAFAGSERTGVYISTNAGITWNRSNSGLTSYEINSMVIKGNAVFVSANYQKVFRSDDNGATWISASAGLTSAVAELKADSNRVLAITTGFIATPAGLFETLDDGVSWTEIPTTFVSMSTVSSTSTKLYVGTYAGTIYYSTDNGLNWSGISIGLPPIKISSILISGSNLFAGTDGSGVYKSTDNGVSWTLSSTGISNIYITDLREQNGIIYAATWGGGVFISGDAGASWSAYNGGLDNLFVRKISAESATIYAGTDAGTYAAPPAVTTIEDNAPGNVTVYPNPGAGLFQLRIEPNQKVMIKIHTVTGALIYQYEGFSEYLGKIDLSALARGMYNLSIETEKGVVREKIILQ